MKLDYYCYTNKGGQRINEDSIGSVINENDAVFVVADGLGGHNCGELASSSVIVTFEDYWDTFKGTLEDKISILAEKANETILSLQNEKSTIMKSTLALCAIQDGKAVIANTGDSRVYYFHNNELAACTEDHSVAYKKYKAGEITRDMLGTDEDQSSLLRVLGNPERYEPDIISIGNELTLGDAFVLCSDGMWEYIRDEEMQIDLLKSKDSKHWSELMRTRAMDRISNGNDNLSLFTIIVG